MATSITLTADRSSVKKGESVNVSWTSSLPDSLVLVIDDGDSVQRVQVPDSVTVKVKGKKQGGKVKNGVGIGKFQLWKERMQARMAVAGAQFRCMWASMKTWQKVLYSVLWALPFILFIVLLLK
ncbi:MAG: hypothetical protein ACI3ZN_05615 [Candidatus Cryptobacteroides sp.]